MAAKNKAKTLKENTTRGQVTRETQETKGTQETTKTPVDLSNTVQNVATQDTATQNVATENEAQNTTARYRPVAISHDAHQKLHELSKRTGISMKRLLENFIQFYYEHPEKLRVQEKEEVVQRVVQQKRVRKIVTVEG